MDPKQQLNQLDPKLQEAYNRVMGTASNAGTPASNAASPTPPAAPAQNNPQPQPPSFQPVAPTPPPTQPVTPIPQPQTIPTPPAPIQPTPSTPPPQTPDTVAATISIGGQGLTATGGPSGFVASAQAAPGKKHGVSPVILLFGALVFFLVYTLVWVKVFNLSVPFITQ